MNRGRKLLTKLCPHCDRQFVGKLWVSGSGSGFASIVPSFYRVRDGIRKERFAFDGDLGHESQMVLFLPYIMVDAERCKNLHFSFLTKKFFLCFSDKHGRRAREDDHRSQAATRHCALLCLRRALV
jgi:hypothetical protein